MKQSNIYGIKNTINGRWYIGSSKDIYHRKANHYSKLKHNRHENQLMQKDYLEYGEKVFEFSILEYTPGNMLSFRERFWIDFYKSDREGYNIVKNGGSRERKTRVHTGRKVIIDQAESERRSQRMRLLNKRRSRNNQINPVQECEIS